MEQRAHEPTEPDPATPPTTWSPPPDAPPVAASPVPPPAPAPPGAGSPPPAGPADPPIDAGRPPAGAGYPPAATGYAPAAGPAYPPGTGQPPPYDPYAWTPQGPRARVHRPSPPWMGLPEPPPRWGIGDIFIGLALWLVASIVFAIPGIVAASSDLAAGREPQITGLWSVLALVGSWTGLIGWLFYASRRKGCRTFARDFGFRFRWIDPLIGFGAGFITLIVTGVLSSLIAAAFGEEPVGNAEAIFSGQEASPVGLVLMAIGGAIGAPIVEELFFRGLALRAFERRFGPIVGVIGSTLVFTLLHFQPGTPVSVITLFLVIGGYAVVLALLARGFRRLGPSIFAHMTINGIGVALLVYTHLYP